MVNDRAPTSMKERSSIFDMSMMFFGPARRSFMVGISQFYQRSVAYPGYGPPGGGFAPFSMRRSQWAGWFQDDIKLTRDLTINLGLRYEYNSVPFETGNRLAGIVNDPNFLPDKSLLYRMVLNPQPIYREDYGGLAPRVGFAWNT